MPCMQRPQIVGLMGGLRDCLRAARIKKQWSSNGQWARAQGLGITPQMNAQTVMIIFGKFIYLFAISMIMGLAFGFGASLLLKKYTPSGVPQVCWLSPTSMTLSC